jgi:hypothetical protein
MIDPRRKAPEKRTGVKVWIPHFSNFGYSQEEAGQIVKIAEQLWSRYTARGLTIDSPHPAATALDEHQVLVQAMCHFGLRAVFDDMGPDARRSTR